MRKRPQDCIQNLIEILAHLFGKEAQDQIAVLLKQSIPSVGAGSSHFAATVSIMRLTARYERDINE
jgi:hypothetical protein